MRRMISYAEAIAWIAMNEDLDCLNGDEPCLPVSGSMVAHLFERDEVEVIEHLAIARDKHWPELAREK